MAKDVYWPDVYKKIQEELEELRESRHLQLSDLAETTDRIVQLEKLSEHIAPLLEEGETVLDVIAPVTNLNLADAVREVLRRSEHFRTPRGIRDTLEYNGYNLKERHNNPLASIHGILKRLAESGEAEFHEGRYRWKDRGVTGSAQIKISPETWEKSKDALKPLPKRGLKHVRVGGK